MAPIAHERILDWLDSETTALPGEEVDVVDAVGRTLAAPIDASVDYPPSPAAAVDGFALPAEATLGASAYNPLPFRVGSSGEPVLVPGRAAPLTSGEPLPEGTDTVIPLQDVELRGRALEVHTPLASGENVIPTGREVRAGDRLLEAGRVLRVADAALLTVLGFPAVPVVRRPRVRVLIIRGNVHDAGGLMVHSLVHRDGGLCSQPERVENGVLENALAGGGCNLLLLVGGSGFGSNDQAAEALSRAGEVVHRGVAINPGETASVGHAGGVPVIMLPGVPLATLFAYDVLAGRAVRRLAGRDPGWPYGTRRAVLSRKISSSLGRLECCRVRIVDGHAEPVAVSDGHTLSTVVRADGFVLVAPTSEGFAEGAEVTVHLYDQRL
ncbi:MAG: molybdopterin-binding protein [Arenicellales bacterium]